MQHLVCRVDYKSTPYEVASNDAHQLMKALEKRYPEYKFEVTRQGNAAEVRVSLKKPMASEHWQQLMDATMCNQCDSFAEGFMASSHLWER